MYIYVQKVVSILYKMHMVIIKHKIQNKLES